MSSLHEKCITVLESPDLQLSFQFELVVPQKKSNGFLVMIRALPSTPSHLNDDDQLSGSDVASMMVTSLPVASFRMPEHCSDLSKIYPCAPQIFSSEAISMMEYKSAIISGFQPILYKFRVLVNISYNEAKTYMAETKRPSGNSLRFPDLVRAGTKRKHDGSVERESVLRTKKWRGGEVYLL